MTDDPLDGLFSVPLKGFIEERRRVVAALKAAGQGQQAKEVDKIAKPTVSAWATNQLARRDPELIEELAQVTARLRDAQLGRAGRKEGDSGYGDAVARQREILKKFRADVEEVLTSSGHAASPQVVERTVRNLREGVADETTRALVERGQLTKDLEALDFAALVGQATTTPDAGRPSARAKEPASAARSSTTKDAAPARDNDRTRAREEAAEAKEAARQRAQARATAERQVAKLRAAVTAVGQVLDKRQRAVETVREELSTLEEKAEACRLEHDRLSLELETAETALRRLPPK